MIVEGAMHPSHEGQRLSRRGRIAPELLAFDASRTDGTHLSPASGEDRPGDRAGMADQVIECLTLLGRQALEAVIDRLRVGERRHQLGGDIGLPARLQLDLPELCDDAQAGGIAIEKGLVERSQGH